MKDVFPAPVQWAHAIIGEKNYQSLETHYEKKAFVRFAFISAALISQIIGLLLVCLIGIVIGSALLSFLR
ncbi:hypothetical protein L0222_15040 [bacterium]|nr:hypothetical protein [bacterium]